MRPHLRAPLLLLAALLPATAAPAPIAAVDESAMDRSKDPCRDFYHYACGGWLEKTSIPPDRPLWSRSFSEIDEKNLALLHQILERDRQALGSQAAQDPANPDDPYARKRGEFYAACMDEDKAETASLQTLKEELAKIDAVKDAKGLAQALARLHLQDVGAFFTMGADQDFKDATQVIGVADQGGLGLPDRDYYLKDDVKSKEVRGAYEEHVARMLALLGGNTGAEAAKKEAATVLRLETALARASLDRVSRRDPNKVYHRLERKGLVQKTPRLDWAVYFTALESPDLAAINVAVPEFFAGLNDLLAKTRLPELRTYLRWQLVHAAARALGKRFVDEDFRFRSTALTGEKQLLPRWKRCVTAVDHAMGQALARPFVKAAFGTAGKAQAQALIGGIEEAFRRNLDTLSWMDAATKAQALDKLAHIVNKIGYPDRWRNYDALQTDRGSYLRSMLNAARFESRRELAKIGKPLDRGEWMVSPPTVNAYYNASLNEMVFPAGILQPPFFGNQAGAAANYGAIGMVMGHELTHGFDDEGRKFDGAGNLREWWTREVGDAFTQRAECVAKQYDGYTVLDDLHVNGHLTLGENIADIGGLKMAYAAYRAAVAALKEPPPRAAGLSADQQFFVSFAQSWCVKRRDEVARLRIVVDPHAPPEHRVGGPLRDTPEFQAAFSCPTGSPMAPRERCTVW